MATTHEEADNIIVQQAMAVAVAQQQPVTVLADDTDVYALLLYHYLEQGIQTPMFMESPVKERTVVDIQATVKKHQNIIPAILAGHALTGCDTVAACFGIGKGKMLKVLKTGLNLNMIGNAEANWPEVLEKATKSIASCFGQSKNNSMSEARVSVWTSRAGKSGATVTPKLCFLPTTEAFIENVKRAHLQTCIWKNALQLDPPDLEPTSYGWIKESRTKSLLPTTVPTNVQLAPNHILKLIRCTCSTSKQPFLWPLLAGAGLLPEHTLRTLVARRSAPACRVGCASQHTSSRNSCSWCGECRWTSASACSTTCRSSHSRLKPSTSVRSTHVSSS
ncbi:hypothetical protein GWK47_015737 [Chionoecetes opilio]|uniref:Uncharacterized protein n=1 Tax=Chionoecetes opilio TaxID=41210 RepID=A0A8J5CK03_CHIOP|nr:hypothetical protein GWK47_015737 [Chionoecetes opilio]